MMEQKQQHRGKKKERNLICILFIKGKDKIFILLPTAAQSCQVICGHF